MCLRPAPPLAEREQGWWSAGRWGPCRGQYDLGGFILSFGMVKKMPLVDYAFCSISGKNKTSKQTNTPGRWHMTRLAGGGARTPSLLGLAADGAVRFGAETPAEEALAQAPDEWGAQLCPVGASLCWEGHLGDQAVHTHHRGAPQDDASFASPSRPSTY